MISGASSYEPSAHGPTPSPPNPSQSLAPTGCTSRASAVSASPQPSATAGVGSSSTVTSPKAVGTVTGKAPDELLEAPLPAPALSPEPASEPQLVIVRAAASRAAPRRARWDIVLLHRSGEAHLTTRRHTGGRGSVVSSEYRTTSHATPRCRCLDRSTPSARKPALSTTRHDPVLAGWAISSTRRTPTTSSLS